MEIESHIVGPGVLSLMEDMCEAQVAQLVHADGSFDL